MQSTNVMHCCCCCQAELLLRSEELRDALWAICDSKHEEAEAARLKLAGDGSAAEHVGLLGQHLTSLAQVELDRWVTCHTMQYTFITETCLRHLASEPISQGLSLHNFAMLPGGGGSYSV
jgi:hypothetical protein